MDAGPFRSYAQASPGDSTTAEPDSRATAPIVPPSVNILNVRDKGWKLLLHHLRIGPVVQVNRKAATKMLEGVPAVEKLSQISSKSSQGLSAQVALEDDFGA
jgi:hypothetical protein